MMARLVTSGLLLKGAALVVFLGVLGGATYGVQTFMGGEPSVASFAMQVESPRAALNATPGHAVTYPVVVHNRGDVAQVVKVQAAGDGVTGATGAVTVPAASNATLFLTVQVPEDAATGEQAIRLSVLDASGKVLRERAQTVTLRVLGEATGFGPGDKADVRYTGRLAGSGKVFDTNDPFVNVLRLPATEAFRPHGSAPLPVEHDRPGVIEGFFEGLLGMQPGESRTVTFPAEKGYGPATTPQDVDRDEALERVYALELTTDVVGRDVFDDYVKETNQGAGSDFEAGEVFRFEQGPNRWPYRIASIDAEKVEYRLAVEVGEAYTLYPFWEGASRVAEVNETHARFVTTPALEVGAPFTMRAYWPDMSAIASMNETSIVVRHSPPVGFKFSQPATQFSQAREAIVQEVGEETLVVGIKSDNPLAGEALTFDVELLSLTR